MRKRRRTRDAAVSNSSVLAARTNSLTGFKKENIDIKALVKKSLLVGGVVGTVGLASITGAGMVSAATDMHGSGSLVEKIAAKFNVDQDEVQQLFNEEREARQGDRQARVSERLQALVDKGTITAEQKTAIEAKLKELAETREANRGEMKNLSKDERRAKMDEQREALESWAKEQGLDLSKLKGVFRHGVPGGDWGPGSGRVRLDWGTPSYLSDDTGVRPSGRG